MTLQHRRRGHFGKPIRTALKGLLGTALLVALFQFVNISDVLDTLVTARPIYIVGAFALMFGNIGLQILKWRYFVHLVDPKATHMETAAALLFGISLGTVTPGQIGEFGGRALSHSSIPTGTVIGLTLVDKLQMLCIMGIPGVWSLANVLSLEPLSSAFVAGLATLVFLLVFFRPDLIHRTFAKLRWRVLVLPSVIDFLAVMKIFSFRQLVISFAFSAGFYLVIFLQMAMLLNAFELVSLQDAFVGFSAMMFLKSLIPISLGDLGVRESSSVYLYSLLGIAPPAALNASLLLFVINILIPSLVGILFMPRERSNV